MKAIVIAASLVAAAVSGAVRADEVPSMSGQVREAPPDRPVAEFNGVQISGSTGSTSASAQAAYTRSYWAKGKPDVGLYDTFNLTAKVPIDKDATSGGFGSLDGLVNSVSTELRYMHVRASGLKMSQDLVQNPSALAREICAEAIANAASPAGSGSSTQAEPSCTAEFISNHVSKERYRQFRDEFWDRSGSTLVLGGIAKLGQEKFDYVDPGSLAQLSDTKTQWGLGGFVAWQPPGASFLLAVTGQYQEAYEAADEQVLCPPGGPSSSCVNGAIGPPHLTHKKLVSIELRQDFGPFAIAPMVTYDFGDDVTGVDVPVYLFNRDKGALTGGVRVGWRSDTDAVTVGVFLSQPFSNFGFLQ